VLSAVSDSGRHALWMKNKSPGKDELQGTKHAARAIETIEQFSLQDMAAIQVDVVFKPSKNAPPRFEVWLLGSSGKMARMFLQRRQRSRQADDRLLFID
jgi:hypothetical protein